MVVLRNPIIGFDELLRFVIDLCVVLGAMRKFGIAKFGVVVLPKDGLEMGD